MWHPMAILSPCLTGKEKKTQRWQRMTKNLFFVMNCSQNALSYQNVLKRCPLDIGISNNVMLYHNLSINHYICWNPMWITKFFVFTDLLIAISIFRNSLFDGFLWFVIVFTEPTTESYPEVPRSRKHYRKRQPTFTY